MRNAIFAGLSLLLTTTSCTTAPPVGVIVYRARCSTENQLLGADMHLTAAEAEAQKTLHQRKHPTHEVTCFSTQMEPWDGKR